MKALTFSGGSLSLSEIDRPDTPDEALVRVLLSGICNTDIEIIRGYAGFEGTIGHEFVGVVEKSDERPELVGRRVVGEINAGCGRCSECNRGDARHCRRRTVLGIAGRQGAHAEYLTLPARNLIEVPDSVPDEQAVFAEPLAAAFGITETVEIGPDSRVAVIGDGKLGLLCAMSLATSTSKISMIGKHPNKLELLQPYGVETILLSDLPESTAGEFDVVIEASGSESGFGVALDLVRPRGKIVLKSTFHGEPKWDASRVVVNEVAVVGSRCGRFKPALELLKSGKVAPETLISDEFSLSDGIEAMRLAQTKGSLKVLLRPETH